jgi:uncharacterized phage protein gp47/JayE
VTLVCKITATGCSAPPFPEVHEGLKKIWRGIYGQDIYLEPDSQDGQLVAALAAIIDDCNSTVVSVYNSFRPGGAQGAGLASLVKINGLTKQVATNSTVDLTIVGQPGTTIVNGRAGDDFGFKWALPASVLIPQDGDVNVTATCTAEGAVAAEQDTITRILTPTRGWQSVTNPNAATPGAPVESDADLRRRQAGSTALPSRTALEAMQAAIGNVPGVRKFRPYPNTTAATDGHGVPAHSVCFVIQGGDVDDIASTIARTKSEGGGTYGDTSQTVLDKFNVPILISFQRPDPVRLIAEITMKVTGAYVSSTDGVMKQAASDYVADLAIGADVSVSKVEGAANLNNGRLSKTFNIQSVTLARHGDSLDDVDLVLDFDELPDLAIDDITITVVP